MLPRCLLDAFRYGWMPLGCFRDIAWMPLGCLLDASWMPPGCFSVPRCFLYAHCPSNFAHSSPIHHPSATHPQFSQCNRLSIIATYHFSRIVPDPPTFPTCCKHLPPHCEKLGCALDAPQMRSHGCPADGHWMCTGCALGAPPDAPWMSA